jgi:hypothetical protein
MVKLDYRPSDAEAAKQAAGKVVPFPIRRCRGTLADIRRRASEAGEDKEQQLRVAICRHGHRLAGLGVARELIESEIRSMEWILLGSVSDAGKKRKTKRCA